MNYKAVIFDMDGVLIDSERFHEEVRRVVLGEVFDDFVCIEDSLGKTAEQCYLEELALNGYDGDVGQKALELVGRHAVHFRQRVENGMVVPMEGAIGVLQRLKAEGLKLALGTSSVREIVYHVMEHIGFGGLFDYTVCGDEVERVKPAPDIYLKAVQGLGISKKDAVVVEDSQAGATSAKAAGLTCIGFRFQGEPGLPDVLVSDLEEVIGIALGK